MNGIVKPQPAPLHRPVTSGAERHVTQWWALWFQVLSESIPRVLSGTHAERLAIDPSKMPIGSTYFEDDRGVTYRVYLDAGVRKWFYESGTMPGTLDPDTKPVGLGSDDEGFLFRATDYEHVFEWEGSGWRYAPGDDGSGFIQWDTDTPTRGVWQLADGTTVDRCLPDGTITPFATPNLIGRFIKGAAAYTGTPVAETIPNITGSTGLGGAHTHDVTIDPPPGITSGPSTTETVQSGAGVSVAGVAHNHLFDPAPAAATTTNDGVHLHSAGTLQLDGAGEPSHLGLLPYFRR